MVFGQRGIVMASRKNILLGIIFRFLIPVLTIALAVTAFQSGVELSERKGIPQASLWTQLYYAISLFTLGGIDLGMPSGGPPFWQNTLFSLYF